jgi:alcohol dehydrogenase
MSGELMKALVYHGPGRKSWDEVPDPKVSQPTDAVVRVDTTTICGTDLHILKGDVPTVSHGRILGHEGIGTILEVGSSVRTHKVGDRVIISCVSSCGVCIYCRTGNPSHCLADEGTAGLGWILGHLIDGTQAEQVRIPFADTSLYALPESVPDNAAMLLSDIFPTGFEIGVQYGRVKPGDTVAVVGVGPVGLSVVATSALYGAAQVIAVDLDENRLDFAKQVGASHSVNSGATDWKEQVFALTDGYGVDVAVEAVGVPATFDMCTHLVRPGGNIANVGVHGTAAQLDLQRLWIQNINISMGLVNTTTLGMLLKLVAQQKLPVEKFVTHTFSFDEMIPAYETFANASKTGALKVAISR